MTTQPPRCLPTFDPYAQAWLALQQIEHAMPADLRREFVKPIQTLRAVLMGIKRDERRGA